jgi:hypothetical protein
LLGAVLDHSFVTPPQGWASFGPLSNWHIYFEYLLINNNINKIFK